MAHHVAVSDVGCGRPGAPVMFGVLFTSWELGPLNFFSAALALVSGSLVHAALHSWHLMLGGVFYLAFLVAAVFAVI